MKFIVAEIGRLHPKGLTMQIPNGQHFISNEKDVPAEATCGLFCYEPADQFAKYIPITMDVEKALREEKYDDVLKQKNAFVLMFHHEEMKTDRDPLKMFAYAELAAREEMKLVFLTRRKEGEGLGAMVQLVSAASLMLKAGEQYAKLFGFPKVAEKIRAALIALT